MIGVIKAGRKGIKRIKAYLMTEWCNVSENSSLVPSFWFVNLVPIIQVSLFTIIIITDKPKNDHSCRPVRYSGPHTLS